MSLVTWGKGLILHKPSPYYGWLNGNKNRNYAWVAEQMEECVELGVCYTVSVQ